MRGKTLFYCGLAGLILLAFLSSGCGGERSPKGKIIATVNGEPVYVKDLDRSLELSAKRDPMFKVTPETLKGQMDMLIDKRLLIQEARGKKLDQTDRFIDTIKAFWEQTLIRDLVNFKDKEISSSVSVSGEEVRDYHDNMSHQKTFKVVKSADKDRILKLARMEPSSIEWQETIGPVNYDDISSPLIMKAFELQEGKTGVIKERDTYYLFYVTGHKTIPVAPVSEIKAKIEQKISGAKKQESFRNWLRDVKGKADVEINKDVLEEVERKYE
jgi:hypothetical protein